MTEIRCTVTDCSYKQNYLCKKTSVKITGKKAKDSDDTYCDSYKKTKVGFLEEFANELLMTNKSKITCDISSCSFFSDNKCSKSEIDVRQQNNTYSEYKTTCSSFEHI